MSELEKPSEPVTAPKVVGHYTSNPVERAFERLIFMSRWLLAPFYLGLALALVALLYDFVVRAYHMQLTCRVPATTRSSSPYWA